MNTNFVALNLNIAINNIKNFKNQVKWIFDKEINFNKLFPYYFLNFRNKKTLFFYFMLILISNIFSLSKSKSKSKIRIKLIKIYVKIIITFIKNVIIYLYVLILNII